MKIIVLDYILYLTHMYIYIHHHHVEISKFFYDIWTFYLAALRTEDV